VQKSEMFALHTKCLADFKFSNAPVFLSVKVVLSYSWVDVGCKHCDGRKLV